MNAPVAISLQAVKAGKSFEQFWLGGAILDYD